MYDAAKMDLPHGSGGMPRATRGIVMGCCCLRSVARSRRSDSGRARGCSFLLLHGSRGGRTRSDIGGHCALVRSGATTLRRGRL